MGIGVVLEQIELAVDVLVRQAPGRAVGQPQEDALSGPIVRDEFGEVVTLGRRVFGMGAHIQIDPGAVAEKDIARAAPGHDIPEQMARGLVGAQPPLPP